MLNFTDPELTVALGQLLGKHILSHSLLFANQSDNQQMKLLIFPQNQRMLSILKELKLNNNIVNVLFINKFTSAGDLGTLLSLQIPNLPEMTLLKTK